MTRNPHHPAHPERICWGCEQHCPAENLVCGRDTVRTPHPVELFGNDWDVDAQALLQRSSSRQ